MVAREGERVEVGLTSFFFFLADDPLLFYEIYCDFLLYLGWVLHCFELVSGPYS